MNYRQWTAIFFLICEKRRYLRVPLTYSPLIVQSFVNFIADNLLITHPTVKSYFHWRKSARYNAEQWDESTGKSMNPHWWSMKLPFHCFTSKEHHHTHPFCFITTLTHTRSTWSTSEFRVAIFSLSHAEITMRTLSFLEGTWRNTCFARVFTTMTPRRVFRGFGQRVDVWWVGPADSGRTKAFVKTKSS